MENPNVKTQQENEERVAEEFLSSLADLNCNSKPLINMLTMLAEENIEYASIIVKVVDKHIVKVSPDFKLPILYLIDSIVKNVKGTYVNLFSQCIVNLFCGVFEKVNEKVRERMYSLRQTWNEVFTPQKLYALDVKVKQIDHNWPITAKQLQPAIHVNPNFLKSVTATKSMPTDMEEILHVKTRELLELRKRKLELELEATKKHLEIQEKELFKTAEGALQQPVDISIESECLAVTPFNGIPAMPPQIQSNELMKSALHQPHDYPHKSISTYNKLQHPPPGLQIDLTPADEYSQSIHKNLPKSSVKAAGIIQAGPSRDPRLIRHQSSNQNKLETDNSFPIDSLPPNNVYHSDAYAKRCGKLEKSRVSEPASASFHHMSTDRSSSRSGKRSNSSRDKMRDKDRKRNKSKSPNSSNRRETTMSGDHLSPKQCDKDAFEIAPLSSDFKRKSSSPVSLSQKKIKDKLPRSKYQSGTTKTKKPFEKECNLRKLNNVKKSENLERFQRYPNMDNKNKNVSDVGYGNKKSDKLLNVTKNKKPTISSKMPDAVSVKSSFGSEGKDTMEVFSGSDFDQFSESKKRPSFNDGKDSDLPKTKRLKSAKLDSLFGKEDVDLRTVLPAQTLQNKQEKNNNSLNREGTDTLASKNFNLQAGVENWDNVKISDQNVPNLPSNLDDVRAKLAKAAKYNKIDKTNGELSHRFGLAELHNSEDTQEANDEKIRTILVQAQELLDANSISQDQYKSLVQTVMSINEENKLMEAKRQESIHHFSPKGGNRAAPIDAGDEKTVEAQRSAARTAVLKKRIPRLTKSGKEKKFADVHGKESASDSNQTYPSSRPKLTRSERRGRYGQRSEHPEASNGGNMAQQKHWNLNSGSSYNQSSFGFQGPVTNQPIPPPLLSQNIRIPEVPWTAGGNIPPQPFINSNPVSLPESILPQLQNQLGLSTSLPTISQPCNSINNPQTDLMRTITIDGLTKEIRIYENVAIVFMEADQPREIGFQAGQRAITIDHHDPIILRFNDDFKTVSIADTLHRVRFGFPSRELYIDEHWYEIYFGGPSISIPINDKFHILKAEGPPPQVNIGPLRRDLVAGKINMIIDAHIIIPLFLDGSVQKFNLQEFHHTIQFADNLLTVLFDGVPSDIEYGGLPKRFVLGGKKYFIRFTTLPEGIVAGNVNIKDMLYVKLERPTSRTSMLDENSRSEILRERTANEGDSALGLNENSLASKLTPVPLMETPSVTPLEESSGNNEKPLPSSTSALLPALNKINIDELFQKLVSSGILSSAIPVSNIPTKTEVNEKVDNQTVPSKPISEIISTIDFARPDTIKTRHREIVSLLFSGMQCSSCGLRFPPEQTIKYSQHLDWHFRQNRRERDSTRKAHSRKWYYDISDWVQYEEIEDIEEREKNFFETQVNDFDSNEDNSNQQSISAPLPSCVATPNDIDCACNMCHEKFEHFYNEELEEWHWRGAVRIDDKVYHPLCYEDYKLSLTIPTPTKVEETEKPAETESKVDLKTEISKTIEVEEDRKSEIIYDEDDDVIVLPNEEPSITEIEDDDDDKDYVSETGTVEKIESKADETVQEKETLAAEDSIKNTQSEQANNDLLKPTVTLDSQDSNSNIESQSICSPSGYLSVKIKEEPEDDQNSTISSKQDCENEGRGKDEDDDGFEEVGTVLVGDVDRMNYNNEVVKDTTSADLSPAITDRATSDIDLNSELNAFETPSLEAKTEEGNLDKSLESTDHLNLSIPGLAPAVPLSSLVNKIKINISKNAVFSSNSSKIETGSHLSSTTSTNPLSNNEFNCDANECVKSDQPIVQKNETSVSTIPVLCSSGSIVNTNFGSNGEKGKISKGPSSNFEASVSNISVIGSYGKTSGNFHHPQLRSIPSVGGKLRHPYPSIAPRQLTTPTTEVPQRRTVPGEEKITFESKPSFQGKTLKTAKSVSCGVETSGLCSIM